VRVLKGTCLEGDVEEVAVHGVGLALRCLDVNAVFFTVFDHFCAAWEFLAEVIHAPWGDHFDVWGEGVKGEFEADLVVAFPRGSMGDGVGPFCTGDIKHAFNDAWASDGCAKEVAAFVDGVRLEHWEDIVSSEFFLEIADVALGGTCREGFGFEAVELFCLTDVSTVGDDFCVVFLFEPEEED